MAVYGNVPLSGTAILEWGSTNTGNTTGVQFVNSMAASSAVGATEDFSSKPMPCAGVLRKITARFAAAALAGTNCTFTVRINNVATTVAVTVPATVQQAASAEFNIPFAADDRLSVTSQCVSPDATTSRPRVSVLVSLSA